MTSKRKDGRTYLRETQPEVWKTAQEMSRALAGELTGLKWEERVFIFDQFIRELVDELMGPDGLNDIALLPIAELLPAGDTSAEDAGQLVASIRSIFTAAMMDLPDEEYSQLVMAEDPQKALLLLISELEEHNEAARTYIAKEGLDSVLDALKPLVGVTVLMLADRASGNTIEPLTSAAKLKASLDETWGEELA